MFSGCHAIRAFAGQIIPPQVQELLASPVVLPSPYLEQAIQVCASCWACEPLGFRTHPSFATGWQPCGTIAMRILLRIPT